MLQCTKNWENPLKGLMIIELKKIALIETAYCLSLLQKISVFKVFVAFLPQLWPVGHHHTFPSQLASHHHLSVTQIFLHPDF